MRATAALGRFGEDLAVRLLVEAGMSVVDRNWRCREGELDIVARDGATLVFCEVKTRSGTAFGPAVAAVDARKLARLRRLAGEWLVAHDERCGQVRLDVIGILVGRGAPVVEHLRGVG